MPTPYTGQTLVMPKWMSRALDVVIVVTFITIPIWGPPRAALWVVRRIKRGMDL